MLPVFPNATAVTPTNRLDSLFDRVFDTGNAFMNQGWSAIPMAMWEDEDQIHVEAELPGMSESDVEITIHNRTLYLRGERKAEEGRKYLVNGRAFGKFEQAITLSATVDVDNVRAELKDGVLRIDLPRSPESKPRKIALNAS